MRLASARFTIRWLMAVIAVIAVLVYAGQTVVRLRVLARAYRQKAAEFAAIERDIRATADAIELCAENAKAIGGSKPYWELHRFAVVDYIRAEHYRTLTAKYNHAAHSPWISLPADAPEPTPDVPEPPPEGPEPQPDGTQPRPST